MSEENTPKTLKAITVKTEEETVNRFKNLKEQLGITTDGQMLTELLDRFEQPQRVADHTKQLTETLDNCRQELTSSQQTVERQAHELEQLKAKLATKEQQLAEADANANANAEAANQAQLQMQQQIDSLTPAENQRVVTFTPDNLKVIDYVAARESRRRRQQWSISHVLNWIVYARFVKGMLNADLDSVSDAELRKIGVSLKTKAKEAVEI